MTNSNNSQHSSWLEIGGVGLFLTALVVAAAWYFNSSGYLLYYGDAQAHLNISRSLIDSRTPGYDQLGTVWLPVLHVICLPFVMRDAWWTSGLAGTVPVAACFVIGGVCLYLGGKEAYGSSVAALVAVLCFALNPNVLYLATITMTEIVFVAGLTVCLLALLRFRDTQRMGYVALAIVASWWMSLTRYDGWFLIPFIALSLALGASRHRIRVFIATGFFAGLAPLYWMAHNWWLTSNAFDFYNGPYSAVAIQGNRDYPGFHNWPQALHYYWDAGCLCCGTALLAMGTLGILIAIWKGRWRALSFLSLTPLFYVWSVHSSKTPIHLPILWPFGYYNSRYGLAVVVLMAFAAGTIVLAIPQRYKAYGLLIPLLAVLPKPADSIVWKESQVNSDSRRAWTTEAAAYLHEHYQQGDGVLLEFGDMTGIMGKAGIPLQEAIHEGNGPMWFANTMPSGLVRQAKWAIAQAGDKLSQRIDGNGSFRVITSITVKGAPTLLIYERNR